MRWADRHGQALPLEPIFAALFVGSQRRAGLALARILQQRQKRAEQDGSALIVRAATGSTTYDGQEVPHDRLQRDRHRSV